MDGQTARGLSGQHPNGRNFGGRSSPHAWVDGGRVRGLALEVFLEGAENALWTRPKDEEVLKEVQIKKLKQKLRDLVLDNGILPEVLNSYPLDRKTSGG